jgi:RalA-binding protein 1
MRSLPSSHPILCAKLISPSHGLGTRRVISRKRAKTLVDGRLDSSCYKDQCWNITKACVFFSIFASFLAHVCRGAQRGGAHLGSIQITGAQIGRQQRGADRPEGEKEYRHAFLIIESKKTPSGGQRHVLCAESDEERDAWVDELVRYVMGTYNEEGIKTHGHSSSVATDEPRTSTSSWNEVGAPTGGRRQRGPLKDDSPRGHLLEIAKGPAMPISQLPQDPANAKLHNTPNIGDLKESPVKESAMEIANAKRILYGNQPQPEAPQSSSLPTSSPLDGANEELVAAGNQRSNSELGHYSDMQGSGRQHPSRERKPYHPTLQSVASSSAPEPRVPTPDPTTREQNGHSKVKISGPMNGTLIPPGYKFGKEAQPEAAAVAASNDRKEKAKSRSFWNFGRPYGKFFLKKRPFFCSSSFTSR